ncbi:unnamed protein product [Caenorhabditis brenneri]
MTSNGNIVKLDIGGTLFKTSRSTLTKFDGFFKTMLETDVPITKDESGAIFIDRPAKHFELILNYMRDGHVELPETIREVRELCVEAQYYLLTGLCNVASHREKWLRMMSLGPYDSVKINIGGTLFETTKIKLTSYASKFKEMLEGREPVTFDESGNIFFDRSPKHFNGIFSYLTEMTNDQPIVKLNIGGTVFQTSKSTLTKFDGFFKTMLETDIPITKDESGAIFIDRSAKYFDVILNFMRDGHVELPETIREVKELCVEAEYYLLDGLIELCSVNIKAANDIVELNVGGMPFQTTKDVLTKYEYFRTLINDESKVIRDKDGCIFINRSPKNFDFILNYMMTGNLIFPHCKRAIWEIEMEAGYYKLVDLRSQCFNITGYNVGKCCGDS